MVACVQPVKPRGVVVKEQQPLRVAESARRLIECVPLVGIAREQAIHRKVATEHAALDAEDIDRFEHERPDAVDRPLLLAEAEA